MTSSNNKLMQRFGGAISEKYRYLIRHEADQLFKDKAEKESNIFGRIQDRIMSERRQ